MADAGVVRELLDSFGRWAEDALDEATGELLSAEYHGNFDGGIEEGGAYICSKLA